MSNRSRRDIERLDYEVLHNSGGRVRRVSNSEIETLSSSFENITIMASINKFKSDEKKFMRDITDCFELNDLADMTDIELIDEYREELTGVHRRYRDIHEDLLDALGSDEHKKVYPKFEVVLNKLKSEIKKVKLAKTRVKQDKEEKLKKEQQDKEEKLRKEQQAREERLRKEQEAKEERLRKEQKEEMLRQEDREERRRRLKEEKEEKRSREQDDREEWLKKERMEKKEKKEKMKIEEVEEKARRENEDRKMTVCDEIDLCICKINTVLKSFPISQLNLVEDIRLNIGKVSDYIANYHHLTNKLISIVGSGDISYQQNLEKVVCYIQSGNEKIDTILREADMAKFNKIEREKEELAYQKEVEEKLRREKEELICKRMIEEIIIIEENLINIKWISVSQLEDRDLLDREKDLNSLDSKFTGLSEKITRLIAQLPPNFKNRSDIMEEHSQKEKEIKDVLVSYKDSLREEIATRNVSKEKLSSTPSLKIKLEKFSGYNSVIDIYTFQAEFEKLYLPSVQRKLIPDYLKNNYLEGQALILVKNIEDINEIWDRLKDAFGDAELLLINKLKDVEKIGPIWKLRDKQKLVQVLSKLMFAMKELQRLAEKHDIENELYYGGGINKIYEVIGYTYRDKFIRRKKDLNLNKKEIWKKLIDFIESEVKILEKINLVEKSSRSDKVKNGSAILGEPKKSYTSYSGSDAKMIQCFVCGKADHIATTDHFGRQVVQYFSCKTFVEMTPKQRFKLLYDKGLCYQCLSPGVSVEHGKHKAATCYSKFVCKHKAHLKYPRKKHVLVCEDHKNMSENVSLLEQYKKENIYCLKSPVPDFSKQIKLSFHCDKPNQVHESHLVNLFDEDEVTDSSVYILQTIQITDKRFNLFFDSGCGDLVCRKEAISELEELGKANLIVPGPITLGGVGDLTTKSPHGVYKVDIPLHSGKSAVMRGVCLNQITSKFPMYPLQKKVKQDIADGYRLAGKDPRNLPKLPEYVGGETDLMLGIKYLKYFPEFVFKLPTGLTIYESHFVSPDGSRGVVGGPHQVFTQIETQCAKTFMSLGTYFVQQLTLVRMGYQVNPDAHLLCSTQEKFANIEIPDSNMLSDSYNSRTALKKSKLFEMVENAGSEVTYRCVNCRDCVNCKKSEEIQCISIQEEIEQDIIDNSVVVDTEKGVTIAKLPFLENPLTKLHPNKEKAMAVYKGQVRKLERNHFDKADVIKSEIKLQKLGFVDSLENLTSYQKEIIEKSSIQYFIPWRAVWNTKSLSTPCRLVFDASQVTASGYSLNSILAKGRNNMNKLVEILIRWSTHRFAFHTDIRKMYNTVKLVEEDWCYQLYLWHDQLSISEEPYIKVIKTLIYGVKSSGNQAESGLRKTARIESERYPRVSNIIQKDIYVDDCLSGEDSWDNVLSTTDDLQLVLARGGFTVKGFTFSGKDPPCDLSSDGVSVKIAGIQWHTKVDKISLETANLNFAKKQRGKKPSKINNQIPKDFTRRDCVSKVAEIFDLVGKATPITCGMKLDLRTPVNRKLDWDDKIPADLKKIWLANFRTIQDLAHVRFNRAIVPKDAVNLDINTIDTGDASNSLACSAIYARFQRKDGSYSCQLIFSRSKLVPEGMTLPRAELLAASLNATTGHVVKLALGDLHKESIKLTDSQVALHWISNTTNPLKQWVRNKVVEINRLADRSLWRYVQSKDMIADLGTRKGAGLEDITSTSPWINGQEWMKEDKSNFPVRSVDEIKLKSIDLESIKVELLRPQCVDKLVEINVNDDESILAEDFHSSHLCSKVGSKTLQERYAFSQYVIDPNRFRLRKVIRVLALVMLFTRNLIRRVRYLESIVSPSEASKAIIKEISNERYLVTTGGPFTVVNAVGKVAELKCKPGQVVSLTEEDIKFASDYFYKKCTLEIKRFLDKKFYEKISEEKDGILYYVGRILPSQQFGGNLSLSDVMIDLTTSTFTVPIVDHSSPFAFSIVNEVHWFHPVAKHSGIETVLRYTMKYAHIIEGRELVRSFRKDCVRCRILAKRTVDVVMGPVSKVNLTLAPAFYICQVDLFGPFKSYSLHNKRATVSLWFLIFCCCTTGAVNIKVMENYSTSAFLLGFIRFSCSVGYPKMLLPDEGSQLVKGCKEMQLNFHDIRQRLSVEYGVEFETCPVGGHNMHGKVERKIQHVKSAMNKELENERLSVIQWETLGDQIANCVNDTPLALRYVARDIEQIDLLTPNRLMLGRNNERSPSGPLCVSNDPEKIITQNANIMTAWFESWLVSHVPKLMEKPKWFSSDRDLKEGDIVLFLRKEREYAGNYQYGIVKRVEVGRDQKIRSVIVEYMNHNENVKRETRRAVREIVVIYPVDELGIISELGEIATWVDMKKKSSE